MRFFTAEARAAIWDLTQGQPWLVNALAYEACFHNKAGRDRSRPITAAAVQNAREQLVSRRETHLDQLADKLQEERVRRVVEPLLSGASSAETILADDIEYVRDLGLVRRDDPIAIANPIYREVIPRELAFPVQATVTDDPAWYVGAAGALQVDKLLVAFQAFFREHSEHWVERFQYKEAGPQLLLQAFLQRIVNSGGRIEREYGLGRMRTDLLIVWPSDGDVDAQKAVIECKVLRRSLDETRREGLRQTRTYMDRCAAAEGHLVIFDRTEGRAWDQKGLPPGGSRRRSAGHRLGDVRRATRSCPRPPVPSTRAALIVGPRRLRSSRRGPAGLRQAVLLQSAARLGRHGVLDPAHAALLVWFAAVQRPSSSCTIDGRLSMRASSTRAGPSGRRRPCSQFLSVPNEMPMLRANAGWDRPVLPRIAATSGLETSISCTANPARSPSR